MNTKDVVVFSKISLFLSLSSESSIEISRRIIPFISQLGPLIVNREENVARKREEREREREEEGHRKFGEPLKMVEEPSAPIQSSITRRIFPRRFVRFIYLFVVLSSYRFIPPISRIELCWNTKRGREIFENRLFLLEENLSDDKQSTELFQRTCEGRKIGEAKEWENEMKRRRAVALFRPVTVNALAFIISRSLVLSSRSLFLYLFPEVVLTDFYPFFHSSARHRNSIQLVKIKIVPINLIY